MLPPVCLRAFFLKSTTTDGELFVPAEKKGLYLILAEKMKIIPLGGLDEIGKNITVFEYGDDIVVVDCGSIFPKEDMLGIDLVIPDVTYLVRNRDRVRGLLQAERPFFERAAQAAVGLLDREMAPVRAAEREELVQRQGMRRHLAHLLAQHGQDLRLLLCQHAQRDDAVRPKAERAVLVPADRAVTAERKRGGEQALDHRFPLAHADAALGQQRRAVFDQRHVGGRAADVHDDRVFAPGQRAAAERGGSRAGE